MSFPYINPISPIQLIGTQSVSRDKTYGTNYSTLSVGGYMEVYSLDQLSYFIPPLTYGPINYSANTIPINFSVGSGSTFSYNTLVLNSDNISSGRKKIGMLVYVKNENQVYQFNINNYDSLWNAATGATGVGGSTVIISSFGTTVKANTPEGIAFISGWTANTIDGVSGYTYETAVWKKYYANNLAVTGGTYDSDTNILILTNITGGTVSISGFTSGGTSNPDITVGVTNIVSGFSGGVIFQSSTNKVQQSTNLFWDNTNGRLGVGTSTPSYRLDVNGTARIQNQLLTIGSINAASSFARGVYFNQTLVASANNDALYGLDIQPTFTTGAFTGVTSIPLRIGNSDAGRGISFSNQNWMISSTSGIAISYNGNVGFDFSTGIASSTPIRFITGYSTRFIIFPTTANVAINTTTDAGFRFDVNGTARIQGLTRSTDVFVVGGTSTTNTANTRFWSSGGQAVTSGIYRSLYVDINWSPSSGNAEWNGLDLRPIVNQTGGANGITRGLYITPTLTSAFDFRAIETTVGNVLLNTVSGNTLIGKSIDTGQKLQVSGDTLINGGLTATTISATTYQNLPSNEIIINSTQIQSGFTGGILFQSSSNRVTQNTGFTWDNVNVRLDVGGDLTVSGNTSLQSVTATTLSATVKMFDITHPTKKGLRLRHGNLEGPENGVYYRGTIVNQKEIILPDYWEGLVDNNMITVYLTPIGFYQTLFVVSKSNKRIIIDNKEENNHFDFIVFGERKDVDKLITEYKK